MTAARVKIEAASNRIEMADFLSTDLTMPAFRKMHTMVEHRRKTESKTDADS